jgi:hypothetical protein
MIYVATLDETTELGKKTVYQLYKHVLYELTQFVYLERREITIMTAKCKVEVDPLNNYMIRKPGGILKLIDIYNQVSTDIVVTNPKVSIDKVMKVTYFKGLVTILIKRITYGLITQKCTIYKDKITIWHEKLNNRFILEFLKEMNYHYLHRIFQEVEKIIESRIKSLCR